MMQRNAYNMIKWPICVLHFLNFMTYNCYILIYWKIKLYWLAICVCMIKQSPIIMEETKCSGLSNSLFSTHMKKKQLVIALKIREIKNRDLSVISFFLLTLILKFGKFGIHTVYVIICYWKYTEHQWQRVNIVLKIEPIFSCFAGLLINCSKAIK